MILIPEKLLFRYPSLMIIILTVALRDLDCHFFFINNINNKYNLFNKYFILVIIAINRILSMFFVIQSSFIIYFIY